MTKKILVLKTSLTARSEVEKIGILLNALPQIVKWDIDLDDCDKVLRIESSNGLTEADVAEVLRKKGYEAEKLF